MLALEVVPLPVADVDRAIEFYTQRVGFFLDVDYRPTTTFRVVQLTPPGSSCSVHLSESDSQAQLHNLCLVTSDLVLEREALIKRGVVVSELRHKKDPETWSGEWNAGVDPGRRDYASFADFADLDGNTWTLQERGYVAR